MSGKFTDEQFTEKVYEAYHLIWQMYRPTLNANKTINPFCPWDSYKEEKLERILNFIDDEMLPYTEGK